ncbi:Transcriptional regulator ATRX [Sesbania bispinosa]|nr:Transcriptional regulator ATRX [Sesbania bispinosa]
MLVAVACINRRFGGLPYYHEHESLLQENEEEKLSKEEQDMAWEVYRKSLEWEEVQRVPLGESIPDQKPEMPTAKPHVSEIRSTSPIQFVGNAPRRLVGKT